MRCKWLAGLLLAALVLLQLPAQAATLAIGEPAPALTLQTLDGQRIETGALRGKVVMLVFWASWCDPCRDELPLVSAFAARYRRQGLEVLGFSLDDAQSLPAVRAIAARLSFPVGLLPSPWAGGYGRIWHLPVSFVIDRQGRLAYDGWSDRDPVWHADKLERVVLPLLGS
jgi:peroxiredoxin